MTKSKSAEFLSEKRSTYKQVVMYESMK